MKFNPNRYDLILLFAVVSGIYYVIDETLSSTNNAPKTAETLPVVFSVDASPNTAAGLEANTCSLDPSLLYGAFRACTLPGTSCAGLALGTKSSHNLVVHGSGGKDNKDQHRDAKRLSIRTQHAPAPLKRFASVGELRKWAHAGGAAAWRRAERLKHARWQLEVDEYRVAHGLVGDAE